MSAQQKPSPSVPPIDRAEAARRSAFAARADVRDALLKSLKKCAPKNRDDILHDGIRDALADPEFPADDDEALAFVLRKVNNARSRFYARAKSRGKTELPMEEYKVAAAKTEPPPGERERAGDVAEEMAAKSPEDRRALAMAKARYVEGYTHKEVAAAFGVSESAAEKSQERFFKRVRIAMGLIVLVLVLLFLLLKPATPPLHDTARHEPPPAPVAPVPSDEPDPRREARALRDQAFDRCDRAQWQACVDLLDAATKVDPTLADDPDVQAARRAAARALAPHDEKAPPSDPKAPGPSSK